MFSAAAYPHIPPCQGDAGAAAMVTLLEGTSPIPNGLQTNHI